jgi:hypothetical protein
MALGCKNELVPAFPLVALNERNAPAADPMLGVRTEALNEFAAPKPTVACGRSPTPVEELPQAVESPPGPALVIGELVGRAGWPKLTPSPSPAGALAPLTPSVDNTVARLTSRSVALNDDVGLKAFTSTKACQCCLRVQPCATQLAWQRSCPWAVRPAS